MTRAQEVTAQTSTASPNTAGTLVDLSADSLASLAAELAPRLAEIATLPPALLDAKGAARLLSVPESWVRDQANADRIPHLKLGHYLRFRADELEAWTAARVRGPKVRTGR